MCFFHMPVSDLAVRIPILFGYRKYIIYFALNDRVFRARNAASHRFADTPVVPFDGLLIAFFFFAVSANSFP